MDESKRILRLAEVLEVTGLSRTTVWRLEKRGKFPKRVQLGPRAVGWRSREILDWVDGRETVL